MLIQRVIFLALVLVIVLQKSVKVLLEPEERVSRATLLVFLLEVSVFLRVCPVVGLNNKQNS